MSWRTVVVSKTAKLDYSLGCLVVRDVESTTKVHISEISLLIIESVSASVTAYLLNELIKNKVKVIFCDEKRNPSFELTPYHGSHDCSLKLRRQIEWTDFAKKYIWTEIIAEKIRRQALILQSFRLSKADMLLGYIEELELGDASNREGHAAKVYFNELFGSQFSRSQDCPTNAALNFGYSLILSAFNREVVSCGYVTQLGIFHDNMFNQYNLGCDLMEPLRPLIDACVKSMDSDKFDKEEKTTLLHLLIREVTVNGRKNTLLNAIKIYTKSVLDAIEAVDASLIKFIEYELSVYESDRVL